MYGLLDLAKQANNDHLEQADLRRSGRRVRALHRSSRQVLRAERQLRRARSRAANLRRQLEIGH